MKRSKRINRNLSLIGIVILGFLVLVFGQPMFDEVSFAIKNEFSAILKIKYYFGMLWVQRKKSKSKIGKSSGRSWS